MKKILLSIATFMMMAVLCMVSAGAETYGDYEYTVLRNGTVEITDYTGSATELAIPSAIGGKKVTSIGTYAFADCASLASVSIPDSVTYIKGRAFNNSGVEAIAIPGSVAYIGDYAFAGCSKLESLDILDGVESIYADAFRGCSALKTVKLPDTLTSIGSRAFLDCYNLKAITIPGTVETIMDNSFAGCSSLATVIINNGVACIKDRAFNNSGVEAITIPGSVAYIGDYAFAGCSKLESLDILDGVESIYADAFRGCSALKTANLPDTLTSIGSRAFLDCYNLKAITIPGTVEAIMDNSFASCSSLATVVINNGVTCIKDRAFNNSGVEAITIPGSVAYIGDYAFAGCSKLESLDILDGVESIYADAFRGCSFLKTANLPDTLTSIGSRAFLDCYNLKAITIPGTVETIMDNSFAGCSSLATVVINNGVACIKESAFNNSGVEAITIPGSVAYIGNYAFSGCSKLESLDILDGVESIYSDAFRGCSALKTAKLSDTLTSIGSRAFLDCYNLKAITIPGTVETIMDNSFAGCSSLATVVINNGVACIKDRAFNDSGVEAITIPGSVAYIGNYAFSGCSKLESLDILDGVESIYSDAFRGCSALKTANLPDTLTSIGSRAFLDCYNLKAITIPESVTTIGDNAFSGCNDLVISCFEYSEAHIYAIKNDIEYKLIIELDSSVLTATAGEGQAILNWTAVDGASYYQIIRYNNGTYSVVANINGTSATVKGLTNGYEYTYLIKAVAEDGRTSLSNAVNVTPVAALAKSTLSATAGNSQASLSWTAVNGASYYQIIRYNNGTYTVIANINGTSATVKGLTNGYEYTYLIKAVAADGRTSLSNAVNVTPVAALAKPTLSATAGNAQATLKWTAVSGASYYQIIRYNNGTYSVVANVSTTSATVKGLTNGFEYTYLIKAVAADGRTSLSSAVNVTPVAALAKPTLSATAGNAQASLKWTAVSGASYYQIIRYNNGTYSVVANVSTTSATVKGLTNGYEYTYLIKAVAADGRTSLSNAVNVTPVAALAKPTLSATAGNGQATLSWTAVSGASYYQIIRYNNGTYTVIANISGTSATVKGLTNNYAYTYLIKAVAADGRTSLSSAVNVTPVAALAKPTLSATAGNGQATLKWTAVSGASYYQIIRYNNGTYTVVANISTTSATVKGLTNNYAYTYLIKAVAADGRTSFSNAVNVTPKA